MKDQLSKREYEVASLVAEGHSNATIAEKVGLKPQSVKNLVSNVMRKVKVANRTQLALKFTTERTV
jgi:two-component system, NarL family, response regulator DegU